MKNKLVLAIGLMTLAFSQTSFASDRMLSEIGEDSSIEMVSDLFLYPGTSSIAITGMTPSGIKVECKIEAVAASTEVVKRKRLKAGTKLIVSSDAADTDGRVTTVTFKNAEEISELACSSFMQTREEDLYEVRTTISDIEQALGSMIKINLAEPVDISDAMPKEEASEEAASN